MSVLPSKTVTERKMFSVDFGDILPWNPVITFARMQVSVFSGVDPAPQQVFWKVVSITGTTVVFQVRLGLVGVVYRLNCQVEVGGQWYDKEVNLAIREDFADVSGLYPFTRFFTSRPYAQQLQSDQINASLLITSGDLDTLLLSADLEDDELLATLIPLDGALFNSTPPGVFDEVDAVITLTSGVLKEPPRGDVRDRIDAVIFPSSGLMFNGPQGLLVDEVDATLTITSGTLA
jgi:hypothetical protein